MALLFSGRLGVRLARRQASRWQKADKAAPPHAAPHALLRPFKHDCHILRASERQVHFLPLMGLWGLKHATTWTLYNACKSYGWTRVYRRLLEQNRALHPADAESRHQIQYLIRMAIESPPQFASQMVEKTSMVLEFLEKIVARAEPSIPPFLLAIGRFVVNSQKPVKILQDFAANAASKTKV